MSSEHLSFLEFVQHSVCFLVCTYCYPCFFRVRSRLLIRLGIIMILLSIITTIYNLCVFLIEARETEDEFIISWAYTPTILVIFVLILIISLISLLAYRNAYNRAFGFENYSERESLDEAISSTEMSSNNTNLPRHHLFSSPPPPPPHSETISPHPIYSTRRPYTYPQQPSVENEMTTQSAGRITVGKVRSSEDAISSGLEESGERTGLGCNNAADTNLRDHRELQDKDEIVINL